MARWLRLLDKKRGDRRTGSSRVGAWGELIFFGNLFWLGAVSLTYLIMSHVMQPVDEDVLVLGSDYGFWFLIMVLTSFMLIGGGGVLMRAWSVGTTVERRSAIGKRAGDIELINDPTTVTQDFPGIPRDANQTNSPGTKLKYRLPLAQSPAWSLSAAIIFCLVWNGMTCVLLAILADRLLNRDVRYVLILFCLVFLGIGVWSLRYLAKRMLEQTSIGPTTLEISAHPWYPNGQYEVYLSQGGQMQLDSLRIRIVCEEEATFSHGTDLRVEALVIYEELLLEKSDFTIDTSEPLQLQTSLTLPLESMHSFQSPHNAINWKLVVEGQGKGWRTFDRSFPLIVHPPEMTEVPR